MGLLPLYLITPGAGRKMPDGAEGFGSTASSFLFVGLPWQQEAGSRLQRKGSLEGNKSRNQGGEMPSLHMSCVFQPAGTIIWTTRAQRPS